MATKRRPLQVQVDELRRQMRKLAGRLEELEERRHQELTSAIGFEAEVVEDEDDEEEIPEMRQIGFLTPSGRGATAAAGSRRKLRRRD